MYAVYLDLTLWQKDTELAFPLEYAVELNRLLGKHKIEGSKHPSERDSYLQLKFQTEVFIDPIRSEA